ncbi:tubulin-tyrosine ligase [Hesseltinella vesiculosa]|uniref:Tubulin-tyrosine ligase n=1 Tax=Hesseltinella vesiculosa TaxID=101127 RepID=A0A1X2G7W9_9FUNG|nr:tubulin-tyrosine ligase [Hesseltinella vesiculosa]
MRAIVHLDEPYTQACVVEALNQIGTQVSTNVDHDQDDHDHAEFDLQWLEYELIDWAHVQAKSSSMANAYCIRKGLIRKSQFAYNMIKYLSKHPQSILATAIPETWLFELDHVDYLDEAMNEVFEVERDLLANEDLDLNSPDRRRFILKPSLANKAAGIHVFDSLADLERIFAEPDSDDETDDDDDCDGQMSHIREWVIQRYIDRPLLIHQRKFHVRAYVLAVGNIQVYLYHDMLALFAMKNYTLEDLSDQLQHLTNTCIQADQQDFDEASVVRLFWDLDLPAKDLQSMFDKMKLILHDVFDACSSEMTTFQALPNAFELFGVDFLIDQDLNVFFLEANAFPDFKQTGEKLQHIIQDLFIATAKTAIQPFFSGLPAESDPRLAKVFDRQLLSL